jgi:hypothetical protein
MHRPRGNNLVEYALPIGLVGILLLAAVPMLNPALTGTIRGSVASGPASPVGGSPPGPGSSPSSQVAVKQLGALPSGVAPPINPTATLEALRREVETAGGSGVSEKLLSALRRTAQQLRAEGKINDAQLAELLALADRGHTLAQIQRLIERQAQEGSGPENEFNKERVSLDGFGSRPISNYTGMLLVTNDSTGGPDVYAPFSEVSSSMREQFNLPSHLTKVGRPLFDFIQQFEVALNQGALRDSDAREVVSALSQDILTLSIQTGNTASGVYYGGQDRSQFTQMQAARLTDLKSAQICSVGNGNDTGLDCQP